MSALSFDRRTMLKGAGAMAVASAFAPLSKFAPLSGTIILVEPGNPLSERFSVLAQRCLKVSADDFNAIKRIFTSRPAQAAPVAGLTSWTTLMLVREIALDSGWTLAFEARHDVTGQQVRTYFRLGDLARFQKTVFPKSIHRCFFDELFTPKTTRFEIRSPPRDNTLFSWLLLERNRKASPPVHTQLLPTGAALPIATGMMSMNKKLSADARFEIQDLFSAYSWALDTGDAEAFVACFTPAAVVREEVFEQADIWEGHAGIRALALHFMGSPRFPGRQHHVTMPQLFPRNAEHVDSRAFAFVTECKGEPPMTLLFAGYYEDEIVHHAGRWLFARRTIRLWDGEILRKFPNKGEYVPRKRPADLVVKRRSVP